MPRKTKIVLPSICTTAIVSELDDGMVGVSVGLYRFWPIKKTVQQIVRRFESGPTIEVLLELAEEATIEAAKDGRIELA